MKQKEFDLKGFSATLKKFRVSERYSLRQASKIIGASAATICRIEQGDNAEINTVLTLCEWMNVPITKFIKSKK